MSMVLLWLTVILVTFSQCRKEALTPTPTDTTTPNRPAAIPAASELNTFIWTSMYWVYLWNKEVPNLSNTYYQLLTPESTNYKRNLDSLNAFLNKFTDPSALFTSLRYKVGVVDKWSFINSDYTAIENWINGISTTVGYDFMLYKPSSSSDNLFGLVRYVLKGSPADSAGIKRGDIFSKINDTQLTISNYSSLISKESFSLSFAQLVNNVITPTGKTVSLTGVVMTENPILLSKVLTVNGSKVGYLVYNGFTSSFDLDLNNAFSQFKAAGITKLILDLRYNGGGSVQTAIYLASMIYSTNTSKIFTKSIWNTNYTSNNEDVYFEDKINTAPISSLNLPEVYFIVSRETASASELVINGLSPYMNVKIVGTNTVGKYVASTTIYDYELDSNGKLIPDGKGGYVKVSSHKYAMQPIIAKYANSLGKSDFVNGFSPDAGLKYREDSTLNDIATMRPLGDENETMLKIALDNIKGLKRASIPSVGPFSKSVESSRERMPFSHDMYIDPSKVMRRTK